MEQRSKKHNMELVRQAKKIIVIELYVDTYINLKIRLISTKKISTIGINIYFK